ncbi:MAG: PilZ domain-containing protein [Candidatus Muiribacteriota bacterium]|jgi:c-di-GMP-binding flagellar brake protein YcgR
MADGAGEHLEKLEQGLNLLIEVKSGLFRGNYLSSIVKIVKNQELYIQIPENNDGTQVKFWPKTLLSLSFFRENEPGAIYIFNEPLIRIEEGVKPNLVIDFPKSIERIQRRNYVRVDVRLPFYYQKYTLSEEPEIIPILKKGYIMDVSGGGVFLRTPEKMEKDQFVQTKFKLGDEEFDIKGKIMRAISIRRGKSVMYKYGINFEEIIDMVRRKIIGYVFDVERSNIRKQKEAY